VFNAPSPNPEAKGEVVPETVTFHEAEANAEIVEFIHDKVDTAKIEYADVIVSGGRGLRGPAGFKLLQELADELGGVVGSSRGCVDAGWIPYSRQVGQTGKVVKPDVYIALGISGAVQHKVGMQGAETIIAINRDADAPIAEFADLFVVGDLFEVGPALVALLRQRQGG